MAGGATRARATAVNGAANGAETVVLTIPMNAQDYSNQNLNMLPSASAGFTNNDNSGVMNVTAGTGTTAVTIRCRANSVTGRQVGTSQVVTLAAAASTNIAWDFIDSIAAQVAAGAGNAAVNVGSYVITLQGTGTTAANVVNEIVGHLESYI